MKPKKTLMLSRFAPLVFFVAFLLSILAPMGMCETNENASLPPPEALRVKTAPQAFEMSWWSIDAGGGISGDGAVTLTASIGQPESGFSNCCGTVIDGGVWGTAIDLQALFCDGFESSGTGSWSNVNGDVNVPEAQQGEKEVPDAQ